MDKTISDLCNSIINIIDMLRPCGCSGSNTFSVVMAGLIY